MIKTVLSQTHFSLNLKVVARAIVLTLLSGISEGVVAQAQLIKDINTAQSPYVQEYTEVINDGNGNVYFISQGQELWITKTSVTPQTAVMLKKMKSISNLTVAGGTIFFVGEDGAGKELWKSNGSGSTTRKVKEIRSGSQGSNPSHLVNINGVLYFAANNGVHGNELWKSNGTDAGTVMVKDFNPGSADGNPQWMTELNGMIYLAATGASKGSELWKTDGTSAGSSMVLDIYIGVTGSDPAYLTRVNGHIFFAATNQQYGRELWITDGTLANTDIIKDMNPGAGSSVFGLIIALGNTAYISADDGSHGFQLWKSTGFNATERVTSHYELCNQDPESEDYDPDCEQRRLKYFEVIGNALYYTTSNSGNSEMYRVDGTTGAIKAVGKRSYDRYDPSYTLMGDWIYFFNFDWIYFKPDDPNEFKQAVQLYRMSLDGSATELVRNFYHAYSFEAGQLPQTAMTMVNGQLYFPAIFNDGEGYQMVRSGGTFESTYPVKDTYLPTLSSNVRNLVTHNGVTYFTTGEGEYYNPPAVWRTDGTASGTFKLKNFQRIIDVEASGNYLYMLGVRSYRISELWKTDGTEAGTTLLKTFTGDQFQYTSVEMLDVYGTLYFANEYGTLWRSNGTPSGTILLKDFDRIHYLGKGGGRAIFSVNNEGRHEVWRSNGTINSTAKLKTIHPTPYYISNYNARGTVNDLFYFVALSEKQGYEIWRSDGTTSGTYVLKDIRENDALEWEPYSLVSFQDTLYFATKWGADRYGLFKSDGTTAGTKQIATIPYFHRLISTNDQVFIFLDGAYGLGLWTSRGTLETTKFVKNFHPTNFFYDVTHVESDGVLYFTSESTGLWRTDGTECGTFAMEAPDQAYPLTLNGNNLIFGASTERYGHEPYRLSLDVVPGNPCADDMMIAQSGIIAKSVDYGPNPFTNNVNLKINAVSGDNISLVVKSFTGEVVYKSVDASRDLTLGETWPKGLYIVDLMINGKSESFRLVKK